jgi:hypothetical protein
MSPEEQNLDMLVAELDRENRLLRARNERLEARALTLKPLVVDASPESPAFEPQESAGPAEGAKRAVIDAAMARARATRRT